MWKAHGHKKFRSDLKWVIPAKKPSRLALIGIVEGRADAGLRQVRPQLLDVLLGEFIAVVRMVQDKLNPVEHHPEPCTMAGFYDGPQVVEQGLYFPPVHVCADRFLEYCLKQA
jgi:hypothetical protein